MSCSACRPCLCFRVALGTQRYWKMGAYQVCMCSVSKFLTAGVPTVFTRRQPWSDGLSVCRDFATALFKSVLGCFLCVCVCVYLAGIWFYLVTRHLYCCSVLLTFLFHYLVCIIAEFVFQAPVNVCRRDTPPVVFEVMKVRLVLIGDSCYRPGMPCTNDWCRICSGTGLKISSWGTSVQQTVLCLARTNKDPNGVY